MRGCESLLGLRRGILSETEANADPRTATEIAATSVDYDLTIRDLQGAWGAAVQDAMVLCGTLGTLYGLEFHTDAVVPAIDWGDGVLYDRARIWAEQREMVDAGLLRPELALAWYFDLPCRQRGRAEGGEGKVYAEVREERRKKREVRQDGRAEQADPAPYAAGTGSVPVAPTVPRLTGWDTASAWH